MPAQVQLASKAAVAARRTSRGSASQPSGVSTTTAVPLDTFCLGGVGAPTRVAGGAVNRPGASRSSSMKDPTIGAAVVPSVWLPSRG